ncbi:MULTISPECIES: flagellar protein FliT [unclassified Undibacterium]|uniref:flagellar protein FliT n=1 Tax=unclassified Undibacterium TaxID=2630295 RepID=UPI002AC9DEFC|nr:MULTISPECIES: flagellar protein FliT [unclassified Undibacterium]MEB0139850.1 flagellar protein FliT [Undibacterium sp. CCC2.1]MEB0172780.1 flagellar protein FliT [Undibacterium sp. CCC1.1]MEB0176572.1 flagellar protein FliT [Undibacterium sp. CCC3.4]MEB0215838.1 flagellar protein FliT [Undibacterium sp. 5I2]WPX42689.1 flagellar protein FliT [Undibacterium sp. CCC3.4]
MESLEIITLYEHIAVITDQMLHAARERDWELLTRLESDCSSKVQTIRDGESGGFLSPEQKERKIRVIKKILAHDKEIRDITEPWMEELSNLINTSRTSHKLNHAYGAGHGV